MFIYSSVYRLLSCRLFAVVFVILLISLTPFGNMKGQSSSKGESKLSDKGNNGENFAITNSQGDILMQLENTGAANQVYQNGNAKLTVDGSIALGDVANEEKLNILDLGNGENITIGATQEGMKLKIPNSLSKQSVPRSVVIEGGGGGMQGFQGTELFRVNNDGTFGLGTDNNIQGNSNGLTLTIPSLLSSQMAPRSVVIESGNGGLNSQGTEIASFNNDGTFALGTNTNIQADGNDITLTVPTGQGSSLVPRSVVIESGGGPNKLDVTELARWNNDGTFQMGTENKVLGTTDGITISLPSLLSAGSAPRSVVIESSNDPSSRVAQVLFEVENSGNVGIGTDSPGNILTVVQGSLTDPVADAWTTYSSRRWKTNIKTIENALDKVEQLRGVTYDWKSGGKHDIGLIAEEVGAVIPEVVAFEENGVDARSVDYPRLVAVLIEAVKEQQQTINQLKKQNASAETELLQTKTVLNKLEAKLGGVEELAAKMNRLEAAMQRLETQNAPGTGWSSSLTGSK